jgi:hypothetical protein
MSVTTRAAALKSKTKEDDNFPVIISSKNKKKSRSKQQPKQHEEQPPASSVQSEVRPTLEQQSSSLQTESMIHASSRHQDEDKNEDDGLDISLESLFIDQEAVSSTTNARKVIEEIVQN